MDRGEAIAIREIVINPQLKKDEGQMPSPASYIKYAPRHTNTNDPIVNVRYHRRRDFSSRDSVAVSVGSDTKYFSNTKFLTVPSILDFGLA